MDYSTHRVYNKRAIVMAMLMIIVGILSLQFRYEHLDITDWHSVVRLLSGISLIVAGALMLTPRFRDIMPAVGLMCLGIGLSRFLVGISYAMRPQEAFGIHVILDNVMWVLGYIILIFSIYQLYRGFNFMRMDAMNAFVMRFSSIGIVIAYVLLLIYAGEFLGFDVFAMWDFRRDFVTTPILYTMYFILLCSKEVYDMMSWETVRRGIFRAASRLNPGSLTLTSGEFRDLESKVHDESGWTVCQNESPIEREFAIPLKADGPDMLLMLEKWRTGNTFYSLILADGTGYVSRQHGRVKDIVFQDDGFEVYNDRNLAMRVQVYDEPPKVHGWRAYFGPEQKGGRRQ
ncbi:MAG: hypothetical protein MJZ38_00810 [archaeon]|nr:hypothetical protein [archaeon]